MGNERAGKHDVTIEVTYKDSMRIDHSLTYDTTIDVGGFTILDGSSDDSSLSTEMYGVVAVVIAALVGIVIYRKKKNSN